MKKASGISDVKSSLSLFILFLFLGFLVTTFWVCKPDKNQKNPDKITKTHKHPVPDTLEKPAVTKVKVRKVPTTEVPAAYAYSINLTYDSLLNDGKGSNVKVTLLDTLRHSPPDTVTDPPESGLQFIRIHSNMICGTIYLNQQLPQDLSPYVINVFGDQGLMDTTHVGIEIGDNICLEN